MITPIFIGNVDKRKKILENTQALQPMQVRKCCITEASGETCLKQFRDKLVSVDNMRYICTVLEDANKISPSYGTKISRYIASNIIPNIDNRIAIGELYDIIKSSTSDKTQLSILEKAIEQTQSYDRILTNQNTLSKRFNIDKYVHENLYRYDITPIIEELCSMIDTYSMPLPSKYYIALENVLYSLYKNNVVIEDTNMVAESVTDYFLFRDLTIPDSTYKMYQKILSESTYYNPSTKLIKEMLDNPAQYFSTKIEELADLATDHDTKYRILKILQLQNEGDISTYIDSLSGLKDTDTSKYDRGLIYKAVSYIPSITGVPDTFISIEKDSKLSDDINDCLAVADAVINSKKVIKEDKSAAAQMKTILESKPQASDVEELITKFKTDQNKSSGKFKNLITKLYAKKPQDIIAQTPSILGIARRLLIVGATAFSPIGPILSSVASVADWLIGRKINDKESEKLLQYFRAEKKAVDEQLKKDMSAKKKDELTKYQKQLEASITKIEDYADSISDTDHSDPDSDDLDDFDLDFESADIALNATATIMESAEKSIQIYEQQYISEDYTKFSEIPEIKNTVKSLANNGLLNEFTEMVKLSSIDINEYASVLNSIYLDSKSPARLKQIVGAQRRNLETSHNPNTIKGIVESTIANEAVDTVIHEKFNLNSIKLALQDAKRKLKDLTTKQKSMWQSVDAAASGFLKSVEKAMTSDRREAIIKGSILPSFSKCVKSAVALAGVGIAFGPMPAVIGALGMLGTSAALTTKEKKLLIDEIDTELKVVEKQIEISQNDGDMNQYRFLLNYQKKLVREMQRIRYGLKVTGRDIPTAVLPGNPSNN